MSIYWRVGNNNNRPKFSNFKTSKLPFFGPFYGFSWIYLYSSHSFYVYLLIENYAILMTMDRKFIGNGNFISCQEIFDRKLATKTKTANEKF